MGLHLSKFISEKPVMYFFASLDDYIVHKIKYIVFIFIHVQQNNLKACHISFDVYE